MPPLPARVNEPGISELVSQAQQELERRREQACVRPARCSEPSASGRIPEPPTCSAGEASPSPRSEKTVTVYPSLLLAMLKQNQEAAGRVYLLLRYLDKAGRGWLPVAEIREQLTRKGSPLKVIGWRRLRQLLHQGEGVFWERDREGRLWLRSALKIALELDCNRLKGKRVDLPIKTLLGGIGEVRAHFYASFHSGRTAANPISRQTLESITGLSPRTQRDYDRIANVQRQRNLAVGPKHTQLSAEETVLAAG